MPPPTSATRATPPVDHRPSTLTEYELDLPVSAKHAAFAHAPKRRYLGTGPFGGRTDDPDVQTYYEWSRIDRERRGLTTHPSTGHRNYQEELYWDGGPIRWTGGM